ncbi:hypothetical protein GCM10010435_86650 [Winogradskya consettensis]|uniref:Uncharacterized protein n=1 Tax=Winogradskya consettensis TaxID=113560 RepID=A0A919T571_9ACTN|nr:hypothetical protein [Actinoplanes consettensis]GIM85592.1 hypothetical protein Aco04nite_96940 [Actinoplanes consettensis]
MPGSHAPGPPPLPEVPERTFEDVMRARVDRRRDRVHRQVSAARQGGHRIPTWLLAAILGALLLGWLYIIFLG